MKINGMPANTERWIVYRTIDGENWFWGSWHDLDKAMTAAVDIDGEVVSDTMLEG